MDGMIKANLQCLLKASSVSRLLVPSEVFFYCPPSIDFITFLHYWEYHLVLHIDYFSLCNAA